jgi:hypothetical protein
MKNIYSRLKEELKNMYPNEEIETFNDLGYETGEDGSIYITCLFTLKSGKEVKLDGVERKIIHIPEYI